MMGFASCIMSHFQTIIDHRTTVFTLTGYILRPFKVFVMRSFALLTKFEFLSAGS
jgi:hypothetical protein